MEVRLTAVEGRVTLVEALVEAQIVQLRADMNNGFSALSSAINRMHSEIMSRFERVDRRFDAMEQRLERHDKELSAIRQRLQ